MKPIRDFILEFLISIHESTSRDIKIKKENPISTMVNLNLVTLSGEMVTIRIANDDWRSIHEIISQEANLSELFIFNNDIF